ncbi:uncharacterized protein LOC131017896 [Salvia miltiorrhiza]|uniref:uncharacterized protein LOC131017896 n=1 Tax=Salvia miltiorrhiza TaxID=226208 RepID=UPI0025ACD848|nr:uncharacterized protein LOC131017896 [Salvia miltiorrhiza]
MIEHQQSLLFVCICLSIYKHTHTIFIISINTDLEIAAMASAQSQQSSHQIEHSTYHRKIIRDDKNNSTNTHEHSLGDKVKDMTHSAWKLFDHHGPNDTQVEMKKKKQHERHCISKMIGHVKNLKKKKMKKSKEDRYRGISSSDSESSSDNDNDITKKKK